jgi:hypothetical protein
LNLALTLTSSSNIDHASAVISLRSLLNAAPFAVQRVERLIHTLLDDDYKAWSPNDAPVFRHLHRLIKDLFRAHSEIDSVSRAIFVAYTAVFARNIDPSLTNEDDPVYDNVEVCEICEAEIPWVDLREAKCTNGHEFCK